MGDNKTTSGGLGLIGWTIIWGLIGYFVYGKSIELALSVALLNVLLSLSVLMSIIPVLGVCLYYTIATTKIIPYVYEITSLYPTWVTQWIFGLNMIGGVFVTSIALCIVLAIIYN